MILTFMGREIYTKLDIHMQMGLQVSPLYVGRVEWVENGTSIISLEHPEEIYQAATPKKLLQNKRTQINFDLMVARNQLIRDSFFYVFYYYIYIHTHYRVLH